MKPSALANTQNNFSNQFVQSGGSAGSGAVAKAEGFNYATSPQSGGVQPNAQAAPQAAPPAGPQTGQQAGPPPAAQYSPQGGLGYGGEPSPRQQEARTRPTKASGAVAQQPQDAGAAQSQAAYGAAAPQAPQVQQQGRQQAPQVVAYWVLFVLRRVEQPPATANTAVQVQQSPVASPNAAAAPTQAAAEQPPPPAAPSAAPPPRTVPSK